MYEVPDARPVRAVPLRKFVIVRSKVVPSAAYNFSVVEFECDEELKVIVTDDEVAEPAVGFGADKVVWLIVGNSTRLLTNEVRKFVPSPMA